MDGYSGHIVNRSRKLEMKNIKATCQTENCQQKGITHEFVSDVLYTVCGVCNAEVTDLVIEEVTDGTAEVSE
jgi:hypothetical protein